MCIECCYRCIIIITIIIILLTSCYPPAALPPPASLATFHYTCYPSMSVSVLSGLLLIYPYNKTRCCYPSISSCRFQSCHFCSLITHPIKHMLLSFHIGFSLVTVSTAVHLPIEKNTMWLSFHVSFCLVSSVLRPPIQ